MVDWTERRTQYDGVGLRYRTKGEGMPVVLLMGLALPGRMWLEPAEELVTRGYRVVVPDNRGTGGSDAPLPPYSMRTLAGDVDAVMEDAGIDAGLVVGVSFGGMVAQHVALEYPSRVAGLMLVATTCGLPHGHLPSLGTLALLLKSVLFPGSLSVEEAGRLLVHPDSTERLHSFLRAVERSHREEPTPLAGRLGQISAMLAHHAGSRLDQIERPTRILAGGADVLVPPENSEVLEARIPNSSLTVVSEAGHIVIHERTDRFVCELQGLVGEVDGSRGNV